MAREEYNKVPSNMANTKSLIGLYEEAISDYSKAIGLSSKDPSYYFNRGNTYRLAGRYNESDLDYKRAIELDGNYIQQVERIKAFIEKNKRNSEGE